MASKAIDADQLRSFDRVRRSAIWAAWGDAVGFPNEVIREPTSPTRPPRNGADRPWARRVGGRFGPTIELPPGTYSDDTQLRLAVSRCIRGSGRFDVEAFSRIELPVFLSYQLGAGIATRAAAEAMSKRNARWYANFFATRDTAYVRGGGNGAMMRVQPHVWAAANQSDEAFLPDVIRNVVVTHGHPRALFGATYHAIVLAETLRSGSVPPPEEWSALARRLEILPAVLEHDDVLAERWLPLWGRHASQEWLGVALETASELVAQTALAAEDAQRADGDFAVRYRTLLQRIGGLDPSTRGSGIVTSVIATFVAWHAHVEVSSAIWTAASTIGSDTDTIATAAAALYGATASEDPPGSILDLDLHAAEAQRLVQVGRGETPTNFPHPDPLHWQAPRTHADAVGTVEGQIAVAGLGVARSVSETFSGRGRESSVWQWLELEFGQRVLIKRRTTLAPLPTSALPRERPPHQPQLVPDVPSEPEVSAGTRRKTATPRTTSIDDAFAWVLRTNLDYLEIAKAFVSLARTDRGTSNAAAFAVLLAEEIRRRDRESTVRRGSANDNE